MCNIGLVFVSAAILSLDVLRDREYIPESPPTIEVPIVAINERHDKHGRMQHTLYGTSDIFVSSGKASRCPASLVPLRQIVEIRTASMQLWEATYLAF